MKRVRVVLVWVFSVAVAFIIFQQGWAKFFESGRWTRSFAEWGYPAWFRILVGVLETGGAVALLVPPAAFIGAVILSVVMLGAFGTLIMDGRTVDAVTPIVYAVILGWIAFERRLTSRHHRTVPRDV